MRQNVKKCPDRESGLAACFSKATATTQQETLGMIVVEILRAGKVLNRKAVCASLLRRLEAAADPEEERHYHTLISLLFGR
ncbi:regulatory protein YcgZ [Pantoea sp. SS70]|uniref:regulatory protein YcgZ n=1 Tax=Pantoea sp. SS70 TaxID=3024247 RepID=UPI0024529F6D|nr:regulatory protein YcgZ [Pantoea sp. SS70]WGK60062.1 regulatory protein YcgZ [Pantoea sp. SS70]